MNVSQPGYESLTFPKIPQDSPIFMPLRTVKLCILQYTVLKPLAALVSLGLHCFEVKIRVTVKIRVRVKIRVTLL